MVKYSILSIFRKRDERTNLSEADPAAEKSKSGYFSNFRNSLTRAFNISGKKENVFSDKTEATTIHGSTRSEASSIASIQRSHQRPLANDELESKPYGNYKSLTLDERIQFYMQPISASAKKPLNASPNRSLSMLPISMPYFDSGSRSPSPPASPNRKPGGHTPFTPKASEFGYSFECQDSPPRPSRGLRSPENSPPRPFAVAMDTKLDRGSSTNGETRAGSYMQQPTTQPSASDDPGFQDLHPKSQQRRLAYEKFYNTHPESYQRQIQQFKQMVVNTENYRQSERASVSLCV